MNHLDGRVPVVLKNRAKMEKEIQIFLNAKDLAPELVNTGELCDSLMDEATHVPFSSWIMNLFKGCTSFSLRD